MVLRNAGDFKVVLRLDGVALYPKLRYQSSSCLGTCGCRRAMTSEVGTL